MLRIRIINATAAGLILWGILSNLGDALDLTLTWMGLR